jgi:hypothetical protein
MRKIYEKRIRELFADGFSISELGIMYKVSPYRVELALEASDENI